MRILVTGATSGLGRNLIETLQAHHQVIATGRNETVGHALKSQGFQFISADLREREAVGRLCKNIDAVYHCAALSCPWGSYQDFYEANVVTSQNLVEQCVKHGVSRFIYVSSPSIYFDFTEKFGITEETPLPKRFVNHYALTKWMGEQIVDKAFTEKGLPTLTIRPRAIFGPYDRTLMPRLMRLAQRGRVPLIKGGKVLMDLTYVSNVVDSLVNCLTVDPSFWGKKYNITNGEPTLLTDFLASFFRGLDCPYRPLSLPYAPTYFLAAVTEWLASMPFFTFEPPLTRYGVGVLAFGQTFDLTAARQDLSYSPKVSLQQGITFYTDWLRKNRGD